MIDFACKRFDIEEVVKCALGLTRSEFIIFKHFRKTTDRWYTSEDIAQKLSLDVSTVQRAVKKLFEKDVISRKQHNLTGGGYIFSYQCKGKASLRKKIIAVIGDWTEMVDKELKRI